MGALRAPVVMRASDWSIKLKPTELAAFPQFWLLVCRCHTAIIERQATAIILIRKNGRPWKKDCPAAIARNEILRVTRHYGRAFWKRWTGYHPRRQIGAKMRCVKAIGERIAARHPGSQTAEIQIRIALINRFNSLGTAEIIRVA